MYNLFLAERIRYFHEHRDDPLKCSLNYYDNARSLKELKQDPRFAWLKEAYSQVLQQSLKDLDRAYQNFFRKRTNHPRFHKKHARQSIRYPQGVKLGKSWVALPKIGRVKAVIHRPCTGKIKNVCVSKTKSGHYFASVQVEVDVPEPAPKTGVVGVDLGLKSFLVTSEKVVIPAPKYLLKAQQRLARLQRRLSRSQKGSHGREKARLLAACQHEKVANQRSDFLHKTSRWLVDTYGLIGIEDLHVRGMLQNHCLARTISDAGWSELRRQLHYKAAWYGSRVVEVDRYFPSSKRCSDCRYVLPELALSVRKWTCPKCGTYHERDQNAAINLKL